MVISEADCQLHLHEITLDPDIGLRQVFSLDSQSLADEGVPFPFKRLYGSLMAKLSCSHTCRCLMLGKNTRIGM